MNMKKLLLITTLAFLLGCGRASAQTFVQAANGTTASGTAVTVTVTTTANNTLILFTQESVNNTSTVVITDSSGTGTWTQASTGYVANGTTNRCAMWIKPNSAAVTTITATWSGSLTAIIEGIVFEFSGMGAAIEDSSQSNIQTAVTTATSAALTTTNANDVLVFGARVSGAFTSPTAGAGYTIPTNGSATRSMMQFKIVAATQSAVTTTMTWTNSLNDANIFAGVEAVAAGAATPSINMRRKKEALDDSTT